MLGLSGAIALDLPAVRGVTDASASTLLIIGNTRDWVRVSNASGSADSNTATISVSFADDPLVAGTTVAKAAHITELRVVPSTRCAQRSIVQQLEVASSPTRFVRRALPFFVSPRLR